MDPEINLSSVTHYVVTVQMIIFFIKVRVKISHQAPLLPFKLLFCVVSVNGMFKNLLGVTQQVVSTFVMAHDVNQLQVLPGEQQAVEVVQVDIFALVILESFQQSGNDGPFLFNPVVQIPCAEENPALSAAVGVDGVERQANFLLK